MPAAAAMFTEEIGYPPYTGSGQVYRQSVAALIRAGHTFVRSVDGEVLFTAAVGSVALGVAQLRGVWVAPRRCALSPTVLSPPLVGRVDTDAWWKCGTTTVRSLGMVISEISVWASMPAVASHRVRSLAVSV